MPELSIRAKPLLLVYTYQHRAFSADHGPVTRFSSWHTSLDRESLLCRATSILIVKPFKLADRMYSVRCKMGNFTCGMKSHQYEWFDKRKGGTTKNPSQCTGWFPMGLCRGGNTLVQSVP